jgi:hypothetical protein
MFYGALRIWFVATVRDERLHKEFKRQIKTQTVPTSAETAAMLFWALLASGQIDTRKVDGWTTLATSRSTARPPRIVEVRLRQGFWQ